EHDASGRTAQFFVPSFVLLVFRERRADKEEKAETNVTVFDGDPEVAGCLENVLDSFDLAADQFVGIEREKDGQQIVNALSVSTIVAEIIGNEIALRKIMGDRPKSLRSAGVQVLFQVLCHVRP